MTTTTPQTQGFYRLETDDDVSDKTEFSLPDPAMVAATLMVEAVFQADPQLQALSRKSATALIVQVPDVAWAAPISQAWRSIALGDRDIGNGDIPRGNLLNRRRFSQPSHIAYVRDNEKRPKSSDMGESVAEALAQGRSVIGIASQPDRDLPSALIAASDKTVEVPPITPDQLEQLFVALTGSAPTKAISPDIAFRVLPDDLRLTCRAGEDADTAINRLKRLLDGRRKKPSLTLECLHGMDEATTWGWGLAGDLTEYRLGRLAWSEIDRGVLLAGPPGTGKTTFARALAGSCDVPLIAASLAAWQAAGHLGDLLAAMRKTFDSARNCAPCILLIDELDSAGDRSASSGHNKDYHVQVINGLLEQLDGTTGREGVVIVGATNYPQNIDPAITRSGRLDKLIMIPRPNEEALSRILRHHLRDDLIDQNLNSTANLALGGTGADCERWVRGARRSARQERREMVLADLVAEVRGRSPTISDADRLRCAVHEAGHALVAVLQNLLCLRQVTIRQTQATGGGVFIDGEGMTLATLSDIDQMLTRLLAGRAAEEIILGEASSGAGGGQESDLAKATMLCTAAITSLGLIGADHLIWQGQPTAENIDLLLARRPDIAKQVKTSMAEAYERSKVLLTAHRDTIQAIIDRLLEVEAMSGQEVRAIALVPPLPHLNEL
ncbi:MAG: AAA family ATPase [Magnetospirillum sp.]|nr:AAA family ATPase [Magnetospirillum sp.]